jgi:hypothetical protein
MEHWNGGALEWSAELECWNGALEWSAGMEHWNGVLEWSVGMECWNGDVMVLQRLCAKNLHGLYKGYSCFSPSEFTW